MTFLLVDDNIFSRIISITLTVCVMIKIVMMEESEQLPKRMNINPTLLACTRREPKHVTQGMAEVNDGTYNPSSRVNTLGNSPYFSSCWTLCLHACHNSPFVASRTVDGRIPAPVEGCGLSQYLQRFLPSKVVQDFFHPQYVWIQMNGWWLADIPSYLIDHWLVVWNMFVFHILGIIIPTD